LAIVNTAASNRGLSLYAFIIINEVVKIALFDRPSISLRIRMVMVDTYDQLLMLLISFVRFGYIVRACRNHFMLVIFLNQWDHLRWLLR